jgi:hypothetical protein
LPLARLRHSGRREGRGLRDGRQLRGFSGRKAMEWFSRKTSIAGVEIPNWIVALAVVVIVLLLYSYMR